MRKKQWLGLIFAVVMSFCGLAACSRDRGVEAAREDQPPSVTPAEQDFMMKTTQADLAETQMARIALQKSTNNDVKDYANMILSDHTDALEDLTELMKNKNVSQPTSMDVEIQRDISRMSDLTGPDFDREFMNMMVTDHQNALETFRDQEAIAQNPDVKNYVEDRIPKLEMHLDKARRLQSRLFSAPNRQ